MTLARLFKDGNQLKIVCGLIQCAAVVSTSPGRAAAAVGVVHRSALLCCACVRMYVCSSYSMSSEVGAVDM